MNSKYYHFQSYLERSVIVFAVLAYSWLAVRNRLFGCCMGLRCCVWCRVGWWVVWRIRWRGRYIRTWVVWVRGCWCLWKCWLGGYCGLALLWVVDVVEGGCYCYWSWCLGWDCTCLIKSSTLLKLSNVWKCENYINVYKGINWFQIVVRLKLFIYRIGFIWTLGK